ncbi:MAG TPA: (deoxy)nucleoside triphosphate pyrophosphohydrolase [Myxococcota bacterium]|nr:(deoxy)nucleoside triphosphate pyrophosphohydrolase [Myxococcota bacterium]
MPKRTIRVVSAAIVQDKRYLITQRTAKAVLPMLWEFPGGRVEDGESDEAALMRELHHRLGIEAEICELLSTTEREYDDYVVHLQLYRCELGPIPAKPLMVRDLRWVTSDEFELYAFAPADQTAMDALLFGGRRSH